MLNTVRVPDKFAPLFELAQSYVTRYFADQKSAPERGTLEVSGQRYVLVRAASMSVEFHDMVRSYYREDQEAAAVAHALLFDVAHAMGLADSRAFAERMNVTDPIARLSAGPVHFAHAGWAFVDISHESNPSPDEHYYLLYDHPYSFESDSWLNAQKPTSNPVCVMNTGYSSGWCEHAFGLPLVATEILCRAKGDSACRFIMAPPDRIGDHIARYRERHPELAERIVNYQIPGFFSARTDPQLVRKNLELERHAQQRAVELAAINEELSRDIAQRKKTETALNASMELNERLIEALPGGVVQMAKDGTLVRANADALRILGLSFEQLGSLKAQDFDDLTCFEDGSPARASDYPGVKALTTGLPQGATTIGVKRKNGDIAWAVFRAVPTRDVETQEVTGAVITFFDITERKRFEDKLRHTQKLESLGVLAGGIAHDFNNLLVTILGNTSLARSMEECDPKIGELLLQVETGARRAADLTKQMLDYAGRGRFAVERVDLPALVTDMIELLKATIPKQVELRCHFQQGLPSIEVDPTQLRQVIMNLVTNAAEAIGDRSGKIVIQAEQRYVSAPELERFVGEVARPGSVLCLEVQDDGSGMDQDTASRIFDPFFTTKFTGRGLGMAAVLGIVRGHHGAIRIDSREREGTRVTVLLPERLRQDTEAPPGAGTRRTILVVDDDDGVRAVAQRALGSHGYPVLTASNGAEGLRLLERRGTDIRLALIDVTMPEMNGFELLSRLRASGHQFPVLLSSGYAIDPARLEGSGSSGVLTKPYDVVELIQAIERVLAGATDSSPVS
jgi:two-component system cell cycle sensor histidine kinase/response regulator CckA